MRPLELIAIVVGAALMYYRSANSSVRPPHVRPEDYEEWVVARRKRWRLVKTAIGAVLGAAIGWMLFAMIDSGLSRH